MFKRISAFVIVLFMGLVLTVRSPVKADTFSIPFSAIPDLIDAFYTIAAGGKIEISTLVGNITGVDDFLASLNNYYTEHYTPDGTVKASQQLYNQLSILSLLGSSSIDSSGQLVFSADAADLANFVGYNVNWVDRYDTGEGVIVNPDPAYDTILNTINGSGFYFRNYSYSYGSNVMNIGPYSGYSYFVTVNPNNNTDAFGTAAQWVQLYMSNYIDISILSNNGVYSYTVTAYPLSNIGLNGNTQCNIIGPYKALDRFSLFSGGSTLPITFTFSGTLEACLQQIAYKFRNVNIYVDGELWSYVGFSNNPSITLSDSVNMGDTGQITYNTYPIDGIGDNGIDLYNWAQSLYDYVVANPDGTLTMDTVIEGEWDIVDNDTDDGTITQEDEEDIYKVIHGNLVTNVSPTPTPDIGDPPVLKIIPPILDLPDEIWPDGGRDTTVLAQMVHATDVAIPNDIMTIIWSTIGLLVVGGLISILHK